jgi:hypothetical protein
VASKYAIEAVFNLIDKITKPLDNIGIKSKTVSSKIQKDFAAAQKRLDKAGKALGGFVKKATLAATAALGIGLGIVTKQFIEFDSAVTAASAKFKDVDITSNQYKETLQKIGKTAREVAAVTEYNAVDTAGALEKMAMAGLTRVCP